MTGTLIDKTEAIEESGTLVERLRAIEKVPFYFKIDKKKAYREVFERWREKNSLLNRVIKGEVNLTEEYEAFLNKFAGARNYYPHYESNERYKNGINELIAIIGYFGLDNASNVIANTTVIGGVGITTTVIGVRGVQKEI